LANHYFKFKQFTIHQQMCAMKVTTDGCLFGAVCASIVLPEKPLLYNVLDIGAGTGLLSLMFAQQHPNAHITAVEIDTNAANQAAENFSNSPWNNRLNIKCSSIQEFSPSQPYDLIVSNPPFYENQLVSGTVNKDLAHHSSQLTLMELITLIKKLLTGEGQCMILMPYSREEETIAKSAVNELFVRKIVRVRQTPKHNFFRSILIFSQYLNDSANKEELLIKDDTGEYSAAFKNLLSPYYFYL
jgi:tRNA1Val (adenine37-N6)-methyltransferase